MSPKSRVGLTKEQVRRIVLSKLRIVYRDWHSEQDPFSHRAPKAGQRRSDARSFDTALLAALLGGLSEAIEKNNHALFTALGRKDQRMRLKATKRRSGRRGSGQEKPAQDGGEHDVACIISRTYPRSS